MERTLEDTFRLISESKLVLPDFQREYKWSPSKQQSLLASVMLNFPIGGSLLLTGDTSQFAVRKIGDREQLELEEANECEYLLDGQQRTTTLFNAFSNIFDITNVTKTDTHTESLIAHVGSKASPLKNRWFIKVPLDDEEPMVLDFFGTKKLKFEKAKLNELEPSDIVDIFYNFNFNEKNKKGTTKVLSPFYFAAELDNNVKTPKVNSLFLDECAKNGLIPLFHLYKEEKNRFIHGVLERIANTITQKIKTEKGEDFDFIKETYDSQQGFLSDYNSKDDFDSAEDYWNQITNVLDYVAKNWIDDVGSYLQVDVLKSYKLSSITTNDIRRAIPIFCHLNEGGMPLDDFDLVAAKTARKLPGEQNTFSLVKQLSSLISDGIELTPVLQSTNKGVFSRFTFNKLDVLEDNLPRGNVSKTILSVCTLLCTLSDNKFEIRKEHTSTKKLLNTDTHLVRTHFKTAVVGVLRALAFLSLKLGVSNSKKLHYDLMLTPIAYILSNDESWFSASTFAKLEKWYWVSLFSGRYIYNQSSVVIDDLNKLNSWINNGGGYPFLNNQDRLFNVENYSSEACLLRIQQDGEYIEEHPQEAIKTAILQFVLSSNPYDFHIDKQNRLASFTPNSVDTLTFISNDDDSTVVLEDHHIVPFGEITTLGQKTEAIRSNKNHIMNSPCNRVYISKSANRNIGKMGPKRYFNEFKDEEYIIPSHFIPKKFGNVDYDSIENHYLSAVLKERFETLKAEVKKRLSDLDQKIK